MSLLNHPSYDPNRLLDELIARLHLKNDAALARALTVAPPVISKIRHRRLQVGNAMLLRIHDLTQKPANEWRELMGVEPVKAVV